MARLAKTRREKEVWEACDKLWHDLQDEGLSLAELTGEKLKNQLVELGYKRGNQNQIYNYRRSWIEAKGLDVTTELDSEEARSRISDRLQKELSNLCDLVNKEADEKISAIEKEAHAAVKEAQEEKERMQREYERIKQQLEKLKAENTGLLSSNRKTKDELLATKQQLELANEKARHAISDSTKAKEDFTHRIQELNDHHNSFKRQMEQQLQNIEDISKEEKRDLLAHYEKQRHQFVVEIENLKVVNARLDSQLEHSEQAKQALHIVNDEYRQRNKALEERLSEVSAKSSALGDRILVNEKCVSEAEGMVKQLKIFVNELKDLSDKQQKQIRDAQEKATQSESECQIAKEEVNRLNDRLRKINKVDK